MTDFQSSWQAFAAGVQMGWLTLAKFLPIIAGVSLFIAFIWSRKFRSRLITDLFSVVENVLESLFVITTKRVRPEPDDALREDVSRLIEYIKTNGTASEKGTAVIENPEKKEIALEYAEIFEEFPGASFRLKIARRLFERFEIDSQALPTKELLELYRNAQEDFIKDHRKEGLEKTIHEQLASASSIKRAMINLFIVFNLAIIVALVFRPGNVDPDSQKIMLGLYVSLATFIVYVYRSSNARALVLLALKEDSKKYYDAEKYIGRLKPFASPTDRDVEILKLLLLNRSEREKNSEHPYELVLKGVTNSNIMLKGGKIIGKTKKKE